MTPKLNLDRFKRKTVKETDKVVTSVNITKEQKAFLEAEGLELSALIRNYLDGLIEQVGKKKK